MLEAWGYVGVVGDALPWQAATNQRPMALTWMDAAVAFFGYDPLAKVLYRKLSVRFEEEIS